MTVFNQMANLSLSGKVLSRDQCRKVLSCADSDILSLLAAAYAVRRHYFKNMVHIQLLTNAKSGLCREDCHYCSQSRISKAEIKKYPFKGTPFEDRSGHLNPCRCLKILSLARFLNPDREIRVAGGREYHLRSLQPLSLYAANSIFVTGYLTTSGQTSEDALNMIADLGFDVEIEGSAESPR